MGNDEGANAGFFVGFNESSVVGGSVGGFEGNEVGIVDGYDVFI